MNPRLSFSQTSHVHWRAKTSWSTEENGLVAVRPHKHPNTWLTGVRLALNWPQSPNPGLGPLQQPALQPPCHASAHKAMQRKHSVCVGGLSLPQGAALQSVGPPADRSVWHRRRVATVHQRSATVTGALLSPSVSLSTSPKASESGQPPRRTCFLPNRPCRKPKRDSTPDECHGSEARANGRDRLPRRGR